LDSATRSVDLGSGYEALLTDTVGFIRKLPHHLIASFRSTLEEAREADLLLLVVDASHAEWEEQLEVVEQVLDELSLTERPRVLVFNKMDCLEAGERAALEQRVRAFEPLPAVFVSALSDAGVQPLRDTLRARVRARYPEVDIDLPVDEGGILARVYREGEVVERSQNGASIHLRARIPEPLLGRLQAHARVTVRLRGSSS
jgi:GTP-binding protein HflX